MHFLNRLQPFSATALACLVLAPSLRADNTLVYGEVDAEGTVLSAQRIYLREDSMALESFGESRVMIFNRPENSLKIVDHENHRFFNLDAGTVTKLAEKLAVTEKQFLESLEAKVAEMSKADRERFRGILDELHEASARQLEETPVTTFRDTGEKETVEEFESVVVEARSGDKLAARYFLVNYETLGLTEGQFKTLTAFQDFVRELSESTPGKLRNQFGDIEMLAVAGRPVQVIRDPGKNTEQRHRLLNRFEKEISGEWFEVPDDFREETFVRPLKLPDFGA